MNKNNTSVKKTIFFLDFFLLNNIKYKTVNSISDNNGLLLPHNRISIKPITAGSK